MLRGVYNWNFNGSGPEIIFLFNNSTFDIGKYLECDGEICSYQIDRITSQ